MSKFSPQQKGSLAILLMTFLGVVMGIWVRFLGEHFQPYQQVAARAGMGFVLGALFYVKKIRWQKVWEAPKRDIFFLMLRSFVIVIGIGLFTASIMLTKIANVNFIYSLPMTAFLGIILLKERLTLKKVIYLTLAFVGVTLVSVTDFSNVFKWGYGEVLALISTVFYSFAYITRRWISDTLNNEEIATVGSFFSFIFAFLVSQLLGNGVEKFVTITPFLGLMVFLAGLTFISLGYFWSYGFRRVEAIIAGNITALGSVFGVLIGLVVYGEIPTLKELIGGVIIVISVIGMNRIQSEVEAL